MTYNQKIERQTVKLIELLEPALKSYKGKYQTAWGNKTRAGIKASISNLSCGRGNGVYGGRKSGAMSIFDDAEVISVYTLTQAIEEGVLVEIFKSRWPELSGGKPIVATAHIAGEISLAGLREIWDEFVDWKKKVEPTLKEEDRLFSTTMNGEEVWVIEDGQALTLMYPEDY